MASPVEQSHRRAVVSEDAVTKIGGVDAKDAIPDPALMTSSTRSSLNPSRFHSLTVLSLDVVASRATIRGNQTL